MGISRFGKYRNIIISVALFLILDAGVLFVNFFMSFQISADAVAINLAGRQRMLSQRITKSLLDGQYSFADKSDRQAVISSELTNAVDLFNTTFYAFKDGGLTKDANGNSINLAKTTDLQAVNAIAAAESVWQPYYERLKILISTSNNIDSPFFESRLAEAIRYGRANNIELLTLMNDLTVALENKASSKATRLRLIQTAGISLAILNFFLIMFHFVRQLRESDEKIDQARQETQEILDTVSEGLFLLDENLIIGNQYSQELTQIFHREQIAQTSFQELLQELVSEKDMSTAESFIKLLFKPTINQKLIGELNPLKEIEIHIADENGHYQSKYLNFQFSRVQNQETISHVLATVTDVTRQIQLSQELEQARIQNEQQMEMISTLMHSNSDLLPMFINNAFVSLEKINNILRYPSKSSEQHKSKIQQIFALIHGFKGEATSLGLTPFAELAHRFEDQLDELNKRAKLSGNDFLSLTVLLNQTYSQLDASKTFIERLGTIAGKFEQSQGKAIEWSHLQTMADEVASRQNKSVNIIHSGLNDFAMNESLCNSLNTICAQLIRNSISHGIESVEDRLALQKPTTAEIQIQLYQLRNGQLRLVFKDDGAGIDVEKVRQRAVSVGLISETESEHLDRKQLIALIFKPALSTTQEVNEDSGRGMGMSVVSDAIKSLGGKLTVSSAANLGCSFTITLPAPVSIENRAA